jgi:hypothetical protein
LAHLTILVVVVVIIGSIFDCHVFAAAAMSRATWILVHHSSVPVAMVPTGAIWTNILATNMIVPKFEQPSSSAMKTSVKQ